MRRCCGGRHLAGRNMARDGRGSQFVGCKEPSGSQFVGRKMRSGGSGSQFVWCTKASGSQVVGRKWVSGGRGSLRAAKTPAVVSSSAAQGPAAVSSTQRRSRQSVCQQRKVQRQSLRRPHKGPAAVSSCCNSASGSQFVGRTRPKQGTRSKSVFNATASKSQNGTQSPKKVVNRA